MLTVLYFRHKLQKGFLSPEPPKDSEMKTMADYFTQLEALEDLEQAVIRGTKIHKVLKAILKLGHIPKDEDYHFKDRSMALLTKWQKVLDGEDPDKTEVALAEEKVEETEEEKKDVEMTDEKDEEAEQAEVVAVDTEAPEEPKSEPADEADNAPKAQVEVPAASTEETTAETTAETTEETTEAPSGTDVAAANNLL